MKSNQITIALFHGKGDSRRTVETTAFPRTAEGIAQAKELLAVRTVNGYWRGVQALSDDGCTDWEQHDADCAALGLREGV